MNKHEITLSWTTIIRIVGTLLVLLFVWKTYHILILIVLAMTLAAALYPLLNRLDRFLPRSLAALLVALLLLVPFALLLSSLFLTSTTELQPLLTTLENIIENSSIIPPAIRNFDVTQYGQNFVNYLFQSTALVSGIFASVLTLLFLTFFFMIEASSLTKLFLSLFPKKRQEKIGELLTHLGKVNGQYMRGSLIKSLICGCFFYVFFLLIGLPFALPLAIFVAILDLLPLIGPTIGMIPSVIIAFWVSPFLGIVVLGIFVLYQQFESGFLAPKIYNKTMNISPALGFVAVIIGAQLYGIMGAFLALPIAASIPPLIQYLKVLQKD